MLVQVHAARFTVAAAYLKFCTLHSPHCLHRLQELNERKDMNFICSPLIIEWLYVEVPGSGLHFNHIFCYFLAISARHLMSEHCSCKPLKHSLIRTKSIIKPIRIYFRYFFVFYLCVFEEQEFMFAQK